VRGLKIDDFTVKPDVEFADFLAPYGEAGYVFFGVPFDATSTHRKGASGAPRRIREESYNFETYVMEADLDLSEVKMADVGDINTLNSLEDQTALMDKIYSLTSRILKDKKVFLMAGGDHSITPPAVDSFASVHPSGFYLVLDAHLDFRAVFDENPLSHACSSRRVAEILGEENMAIIGVRSMSSKERDEAKRYGLKYYPSWDVADKGILSIITELLEEKGLAKRPIYLSIDMDVVDPAFAPGVGNPEPWGLHPKELLEVLRILGANIKSMDITEVNPKYDVGNTSSLAARLFRTFVAFNFKSIINR